MHQIDGAVALQLAQYIRAVDVHRFMAEVELEGDLFTLSPLTNSSNTSRSRGVSTSSTCAGCSPPRNARSASAHR